MELAPTEHSLMAELRSLIFESTVSPVLARMAQTLRSELANDMTTNMKFAPVPLCVYGEGLPQEIRSSWVFLLRQAAVFQAERHPNSIQRMFSLLNAGVMDVWENGECQSHTLMASITDPGLTIPVHIWHRPRATDGDWAVVSFHTADSDELPEELGDPTIGLVESSRRYSESWAKECL
jgi:hypothetical protein